MYNLFAFAIGVRLLAFIVFVLRLWRKSSICQTGTMTNQVLEENYLCDSLLAFLLLVTYVVWFVFYFGLNA